MHPLLPHAPLSWLSFFSPTQPEARAFHAAAAAGARVYAFGGHVLGYDAGAGRKKRVFYNDLWALDTVGCGTAVQQYSCAAVQLYWLVCVESSRLVVWGWTCVGQPRLVVPLVCL
jgi:hypothetical protein